MWEELQYTGFLLQHSEVLNALVFSAHIAGVSRETTAPSLHVAYRARFAKTRWAQELPDDMPDASFSQLVLKTPGSMRDDTDLERRTPPLRALGRGWRAMLVGALAILAVGSSDAQSPVKQVLVLQSLDRGNIPLDYFTGEFRVRLDQRFGRPVNVVEVVVGPTRFVGASERAVGDYIRALYADRPPPDLIVTTGGPAWAFARENRQQLFPATPLLLAPVDQRFLGTSSLGNNETAVAVINDFPRVIDEILRLLPETKRVFMVTGAGAIGRFWHRELETEFARFRDHVTFEWSDSLSLQQIQRRVATLPNHSAIFYVVFSTDGQGGAYADEQVLADLHARANAPIFTSQAPFFGHGIVGGTMMPMDDVARSAADAASRMLNGERPQDIKVAPQQPGRPVYDWRELDRWDIPESRLPTGSVVRYRSQTLWQEHKNTVLIALGALVVESILIALLLYERRARQRAEIESRRHLSLAADANRRETISALTTSIGHELGQPLSAVVHNAQALGRMMAGPGRRRK